MYEHGILDNGKSETCASHLAATSLVHTIEPFEKTGQMLAGHPYSIVGETEMPLVFLQPGTHANGCVGSCIGDGIVGKVVEYSVYKAVVSHHLDIVGQTVIHGHSLFCHLQGCLGHNG